LKGVVKADGYDDKLLDKYQMALGFEMAPDLKATMQTILSL
jgi:hypothetical protein